MESVQNGSSFHEWWSESARAEVLVDALIADLGGERGRLEATLETLCAETANAALPVGNLQRVLASLQQHFELAGYGGDAVASTGTAWSGGFRAIAAALARLERTTGLQERARVLELGRLRQRLWSCTDHAGLARELAQSLPKLGIHTAALSLRVAAPAGASAAERLQPLLLMHGGQRAPTSPRETFPLSQLVPVELATTTGEALVIGTLNVDTAVFGVWACNGNACPAVFEQLRSDLSVVLVLLHNRAAARSSELEAMDEPPDSDPSWHGDTVIASQPPEPFGADIRSS